MSTSNELHDIIKAGFSDENSLIKQREIKEISESLQKLDNTHVKKGYTIPPLDTIGMNLYGKFSCQIKNT